jgi:hypothetical protein
MVDGTRGIGLRSLYSTAAAPDVSATIGERNVKTPVDVRGLRISASPGAVLPVY